MSYPGNNVLRVIEENVDGCGSDAIMYVGFSRPVTPTLQERFQKKLREVKRNHKNDDYDTENFVADAIDEFNAELLATGECITVEIIDAPYYGVVTF